MNQELVTAAAAELDRSGFLPCPGESGVEFLQRFILSEEAFADFESGMRENNAAVVFDEIKVEAPDRIPPEIIAEAAEKTRSLYGFENRRVPGFFLSGKVGALWGGCMIGDPDNGFAMMLLRRCFRQKQKWCVYDRAELLAHELCHAMRQSLGESRLEEYFAYQTGKSFLRRNFGNCFIRERDAVLFILPAFILLTATMIRELGGLQFPLWPFWGVVAVYPLFLLIRNFLSMRIVRKAEKNLRRFGVDAPGPILFRSTFEELETLGKLKDKEAFEEFRKERSQCELRWAIINSRFFDK